jgi:lysophospholipase L1-like esterase
MQRFRNRFKKRIKLLRRVLIRSIILLGVILGMELIARAILAAQPPQQTYLQFVLSRPAALKDAAYLSADFTAAVKTSQTIYFVPEGYWIMQDVQSQYFNVQDNLRRTTGQPFHAAHAIYVFGSSPILGNEVSDDLTIPSQLQALVGDGYIVYNYGMNGALAVNQYDRLQSIDLHPDDIVIFYDGSVDAMLAYHDAVDRDRAATLCGQILNKTDKSALLNLACGWVNTITPDPATLDYDGVYRRYAAALQGAANYTHQAHATFYHFLQAQIWSAPLSTYEQTVAAPHSWNPAMEESIIAQAWPRYARISGTIDLTHMLDSLRASGVEIYLDPVHMNAAGNAAIARAIYDYIFVF